MAEMKTLLNLMFLFLVFSFLLSSTAISTTRSLRSNNKDSSSAQDSFYDQSSGVDMRNINIGEELFEMGEGTFGEGRMDIESTDYPGTGANNHHDPKSPGRA